MAENRDRIVGDITITMEAAPGEKAINIKLFKELLGRHGWKTSDCAEVRTSLVRFQKDLGYDNGKDAQGRFIEMERQVTQHHCAVPEGTATVFSADLVLSVSPEMKNKKRAILELKAFGGVMVPTLKGGYSHKVGETQEWYQMMNGAIERTVNGYNEETSIHLDLPEDAKVGETIHVDGSDSWDLDGDAFELRWSVGTEACVAGNAAVPVDGGCPEGMRRSAYQVPTDADLSLMKRRFVPPLVGTYQLEVRSKVGNHESPAITKTVRVFPKRPRAIYWRLISLQLPANYIRTGHPREGALWLRAGYSGRLVSRVGMLGTFEEVHIGGFLGTLNAPKDYFGDVGGTFVGLEVTTRVLKNDGRLGLSNSIYGAGGYLLAQRGDIRSMEYLWNVQTNLLFYYSLGPNYTNEFAKYCQRACFDATIGPMIGYWHNTTTGKQALLGGLEFGTAVTF